MHLHLLTHFCLWPTRLQTFSIPFIHTHCLHTTSCTFDCSSSHLHTLPLYTHTCTAHYFITATISTPPTTTGSHILFHHHYFGSFICTHISPPHTWFFPGPFTLWTSQEDPAAAYTTTPGHSIPHHFHLQHFHTHLHTHTHTHTRTHTLHTRTHLPGSHIFYLFILVPTVFHILPFYYLTSTTFHTLGPQFTPLPHLCYLLPPSSITHSLVYSCHFLHFVHLCPSAHNLFMYSTLTSHTSFHTTCTYTPPLHHHRGSHCIVLQVHTCLCRTTHITTTPTACTHLSLLHCTRTHTRAHTHHTLLYTPPHCAHTHHSLYLYAHTHTPHTSHCIFHHLCTHCGFLPFTPHTAVVDMTPHRHLPSGFVLHTCWAVLSLGFCAPLPLHHRTTTRAFYLYHTHGHCTPLHVYHFTLPTHTHTHTARLHRGSMHTCTHYGYAHCHCYARFLPPWLVLLGLAFHLHAAAFTTARAHFRTHTSRYTFSPLYMLCLVGTTHCLHTVATYTYTATRPGHTTGDSHTPPPPHTWFLHTSLLVCLPTRSPLTHCSFTHMGS